MKIVTIAAAVALMVGVTPAWACKVAGPNKHIGVVTQINEQDKNFTIRDAETRDLLTFAATEEILGELMTDEQIMVSFKEVEGSLVAVDIHI